MNDRFLAHNSRGSALVPADQASAAVPWSEEESSAQAESLSLQTFVNALFRWRWLFLAIVVATVLAAAAWASFQTPLYRATATLELNPDPAQVVQTDDKQAPDQTQSDRDFLALQLGLIKSRNVAERVARGLSLGRNS